MDKNKDIFGTAIKAFYAENDTTPIIVHSPDFDDDEIPVEYLFREFTEMPEVEQIALQHCKGKTLDVGCGAGSHALYLQNDRYLKVYAVDTSPGAVEVARNRGVKNASCQDYFNINNEKFDTILMLMNGSGIIGELANLETFFNHSRSLLNSNGKILLDSSDLIYLFEDEIIDKEQYYGEFQYSISYKDLESDIFSWLYIDAKLLKKYAQENGFYCKILKKGDSYDFLAELTIMR